MMAVEGCCRFPHDLERASLIAPLSEASHQRDHHRNDDNDKSNADRDSSQPIGLEPCCRAIAAVVQRREPCGRRHGH